MSDDRERDDMAVDWDKEAERALLFDSEELTTMTVAESVAEDLGLPVEEVLQMPAEEQAAWDRYFAALRTVLETREGQIVIRHWLDAAKAFDRIFQTNSNVYRAAALNDYAQDRLEEVAVAGQKHYYQLLHQGHRNAAFENVLKNRSKK